MFVKHAVLATLRGGKYLSKVDSCCELTHCTTQQLVVAEHQQDTLDQHSLLVVVVANLTMKCLQMWRNFVLMVYAELCSCMWQTAVNNHASKLSITMFLYVMNSKQINSEGNECMSIMYMCCVIPVVRLADCNKNSHIITVSVCWFSLVRFYWCTCVLYLCMLYQWSTCIGYYTPAYGPRARCVYTGYCTSGGVIWYIFHTEAILRMRCSAAHSRSTELASLTLSPRSLLCCLDEVRTAVKAYAWCSRKTSSASKKVSTKTCTFSSPCHSRAF